MRRRPPAPASHPTGPIPDTLRVRIVEHWAEPEHIAYLLYRTTINGRPPSYDDIASEARFVADHNYDRAQRHWLADNGLTFHDIAGTCELSQRFHDEAVFVAAVQRAMRAADPSLA